MSFWFFQPAYSPELNPIERLWEDLKKHFKGKNFEILSALRQEVFGLISSLSGAAITANRLVLHFRSIN